MPRFKSVSSFLRCPVSFHFHNNSYSPAQDREVVVVSAGGWLGPEVCAGRGRSRGSLDLRGIGIDGFVVTHGTNTMAEVAYYMNLTVNTDKPIVFVGSQRPWSGISGDGLDSVYSFPGDQKSETKRSGLSMSLFMSAMVW